MANREMEGRTGHESGDGVAAEAKETAREVKDRTAEKAGDLADEAREQGRELVREGKERARSQADQQKDRVSDGLRSVAGALRRGGRDLEESEQPYGRFLGAVADRAEDASRYLEDRDVDSLTREVRGFARDNAPIFLSGAFTLGMLGARFLKSSTPDDAGGYDGPREPGASRSPGAGGRFESSSRPRSNVDDLDRMGMRTTPGVSEERFADGGSEGSPREEGGYA